MSKELTYLNANGDTVFTTQFLKNKGTCCKTACLHCPYGFTLKKLGLQFQEVTEQDFTLVEGIIQQSGVPAVEWKSFWPEHIRLILLKNTICGVFLKNKLVLKHLYLLPQFQHQDLSREMIESYFYI